MLGIGLAWDGVRTRRRHRPPHSSVSQGWLVLAAVASAGAAAVHITVTPEHFRESALYGAFFVCAAAAQLGGAALLVLRPTRVLVSATAAGNVGIVVLWLVTRLVEVPIGPGVGATEPFGGRDITASVCELLAVLGSLLWMAGQRRGSDRGVMPAAVLAVGPRELV